MVEAQTVYIDDSGTDGSNLVAAAAFCVSTVDRWQKFLEDWQKIARTSGFKLVNFHMNQFVACRRSHPCQQCKKGKTSVKEHPWRFWTDKKRKYVITRLAKALVKNVECGWGVAHTKEDYDCHVRNSPARATTDTPIGDLHLTFAVQQCGGNFAKWRASNQRSDRLRFVFDNSSEQEKKELAKVFFAGLNGGEERDAEGREVSFDPQDGVFFESRKRTLQLLAADMVAWTAFHIRTKLLTMNGKLVEGFYVCKVFAESDNIQIGFVDKQTLADWETRGLN